MLNCQSITVNSTQTYSVQLSCTATLLFVQLDDFLFTLVYADDDSEAAKRADSSEKGDFHSWK